MLQRLSEVTEGYRCYSDRVRRHKDIDVTAIDRGDTRISMLQRLGEVTEGYRCYSD